jgi:hypothetical protein
MTDNTREGVQPVKGGPSEAGIPYPPVFHDWRDPGQRVATVSGAAGVAVEMLVGVSQWTRVELTEADACLLAASLLDRAGEAKLSKRVLAKAAALRGNHAE